MRARRNIGVEGVDTIGIGLWDRNREFGDGHDGVAKTDRTLKSAALVTLRRTPFLGVGAPDDGR